MTAACREAALMSFTRNLRGARVIEISRGMQQ